MLTPPFVRFFFQGPVVIFTSAEYLVARVRLEAICVFLSLPQMEDKGIICFTDGLECRGLQELQLMNSRPE